MDGLFQSFGEDLSDRLGAFFVAHHGEQLLALEHGPMAGVLVAFDSDHLSLCPPFSRDSEG